MSSWPNRRLLLVGVSASFLSLATYGIQDTVINVPEVMLVNFVKNSAQNRYGTPLSDSTVATIWGAIVSALALGAIIGCSVACPLADRFGRRLILFVLANILAILGSACMVLAQSYQTFELILAGRLILGMSVGLSTTLLPVYLVEISPTNVRGFMASFHGIANNSFNLLSFVLAMPTLMGTESWWGWLLGMQGIFAFNQILLLKCYPETAQFEYIKNGRQSAAEETIRRFHGPSTDVRQVLRQLDRETAMVSNRMSIKFVLGSKGLLFSRAFILGILIGASRNLIGNSAIAAYSTEIFEVEIGVSRVQAEMATIFLGFGTVVFSGIGSILVERIGRRTLFLSTMGIIIVCITVVCLIGYMEHLISLNPNVQNLAVLCRWTKVILLVFAFSVIYPIGPGNLAWFMAAELFPEQGRALAASASMGTLWITYMITTLIFPILEARLGAATTLLLAFGIPSFLLWLVFLFWLPETRNRNVVEILSQLEGKNYELLASEDTTEDCELKTTNSDYNAQGVY